MSELLEWILGEGGRINLPNQLDLFLRANNSTQKPQGLYVPPIMLPTFIMNPSGYSPIIQWYDRNPVTHSETYNNGLVPHFDTLRATYTCPAGRKAMVEVINMEILRMVVAAPVGRAYIRFEVITNGGAEENDIAFISIFTNNIGDRASESCGTSFMLLAGDVLRAYTSDGSTGGVVNYFIGYKITEFDA